MLLSLYYYLSDIAPLTLLRWVCVLHVKGKSDKRVLQVLYHIKLYRVTKMMHVPNKVGFLLPELCETSDAGLLFSIIMNEVMQSNYAWLKLNPTYLPAPSLLSSSIKIWHNNNVVTRIHQQMAMLYQPFLYSQVRKQLAARYECI